MSATTTTVNATGYDVVAHVSDTSDVGVGGTVNLTSMTVNGVSAGLQSSNTNTDYPVLGPRPERPARRPHLVPTRSLDVLNELPNSCAG
jgi:hypothetical protein